MKWATKRAVKKDNKRKKKECEERILKTNSSPPPKKKRQTLSQNAQKTKKKKLLNYIQLAEKYALSARDLFFSHSHVNQPKTASKRRIW